MNGFAPSQEGNALPLWSHHPTATRQWAVKVNTCPLSLQTARGLFFASSGCCTVSHWYGQQGSAFWGQDIYIHLIGTSPCYPPPLFLAGKVCVCYCFLTPEKWMYLHKANALMYKPPFSLPHSNMLNTQALKLSLKYAFVYSN